MKILAAILAVGVLATGVVAVRQWQGLDEQRAQGAQLRERISALETAQAAAVASPPPAAAILPVAAPAPSALPAPPPAATGAAPTANATPPAKAPATLAQALVNPQNMEMVRTSPNYRVIEMDHGRIVYDSAPQS